MAMAAAGWPSTAAPAPRATGSPFFSSTTPGGAQVDLLGALRLAADDEARGRGVVGDHALEVELEVAVAAVDDLDAGQHEVAGGQHGADVAARALERVLE